MAEIVTLTQAKAHLRVTDSAEDALITLYMDSAEAEITSYLNRNIPSDGQSPATYPAPIKAAALLLISDLFENRDGAMEVKLEQNPAICRLLYPYRVNIGI